MYATLHYRDGTFTVFPVSLIEAFSLAKSDKEAISIKALTDAGEHIVFNRNDGNTWTPVIYQPHNPNQGVLNV